MAIPDFQTLQLPVLKLASQGECTVKACLPLLATEFGLSESECNEMVPSGRIGRFASRIHWAKVYLGQAGLTKTTKRGYFTITETGKAFLATEPSSLDNDVLARYPGFQDFLNRKGQKQKDGHLIPDHDLEVRESPEERMVGAHTEIEAELRVQLLAAILNGTPSFFEHLIIDLMIAMGYGGSTDAGHQLGKSGDGGFDGVIDGDALGLDRVYLQAKRYASDNIVGPSAVRDFYGALVHKGATKGVFVTTSAFSEAARLFAQEVRQQRLILIDGEELTRLMVKYNVGVRVERKIEIKKIDLDYFDEE